MNVLRCSSKEQMAYEAAVAGAERIREALHMRGSARIVLAAAQSQAAMLEFLVHENLDWNRVSAFHLDEYVGIPGTNPGSLRKFLQDRLLQWVPLSAFHEIAGEKNPVAEIRRLNKLLEHRRIDVAFVGIGENGHLAFNDPPADFRADSPFILVKLDDVCRRQQVKEGWFGTIDQVPTKAITMSIRKIMGAESIICSVPDKRKAKAVKAALEGPVTSKLPASILQRHPRATVYLEPESASLLGYTARPVVYPLVELAHCPEQLAPGQKRFHLFAAADWKTFNERDLAQFARKAIGGGAATLTAWGVGAFDAKLAFESDSVRRSVSGEVGRAALRQIPSEAYKPDELDQSLFYFLEDVKELLPTCNAWVAVLLGKVPQRDRIIAALGSPGAFIDQYLSGPPSDLFQQR
jgi:glucosamine-6-phosphate deaminase